MPEMWPRWATFVKRGSSNGPRARWVYDMAGMKIESDTEVTETPQDRVYSFRQTGGFMKTAETPLEIAPTPKGSSLTCDIEYELHYSYLGKLADKLRAKKMFEAAIDDGVKNLTVLLER